jgi:hypothetical protein
LLRLPIGPGGGFLLQPGAYEAEVKSFCLHAGAHAPAHGDGYLYAQLRGSKAAIIRSLLRGAANHPEIPQEDIQSLIWAIEARSKLNELSPQLQHTAFELLTKKEIAEMSAGALGLVPEELLNRALAALPEPARRIYELQAELRSRLADPDASFEEIAGLAMLPGPAEQDGPLVPRGRWSAHPGGFFVRYLPEGYSQTRLEVYVPGLQSGMLPGRLLGEQFSSSFSGAAWNGGPGGLSSVEYDPTMDVAVPANTGAQRLGLSASAVAGAAAAEAGAEGEKAEQCTRAMGGNCPEGYSCSCPKGTSCKGDVSETFVYSYCCPDGYVPCKGACVPDTPSERRKCRECEQGLSECDDHCTNLNSDPANCGSCGNQCAPGSTCCSGNCVDLSLDDNSNCGSCGNKCAPGTTCCSGKCVGIDYDDNNCGACGKKCSSGTTCCSGTCVDLTSDDKNCGSCGNSCGSWGTRVTWDPTTRKWTNGEVELSTCAHGKCESETKTKCPPALPYPCATSCRQGGPCCFTGPGACPDDQIFKRDNRRPPK